MSFVGPLDTESTLSVKPGGHAWGDRGPLESISVALLRVRVRSALQRHCLNIKHEFGAWRFEVSALSLGECVFRMGQKSPKSLFSRRINCDRNQQAITSMLMLPVGKMEDYKFKRESEFRK